MVKRQVVHSEAFSNKTENANKFHLKNLIINILKVC
jgi:hypothetical protein